jgi:MSHA pilin protein MshD
MPAAERQARLQRRSAGFTLVELVVTLMVISIAVLGISQALAFALSRQSDGLWQARAVALAQAYVEEIMARRYDEAAPVGGVPPCAPGAAACSSIGPDGESRDAFDDVDDYHGLDEQPPRDATGQPRTGYAGWRAQVAVRYLDAAQVAALGADHPSDGKLVTVTVSPPGQTPLSFSVLRGNY